MHRPRQLAFEKATHLPPDPDIHLRKWSHPSQRCRVSGQRRRYGCCSGRDETPVLEQGRHPSGSDTVYSPAEHKATTVHKTKEEGDREEEEGIDVPPAWSRRSKKQNEEEGWVKGE